MRCSLWHVVTWSFKGVTNVYNADHKDEGTKNGDLILTSPMSDRARLRVSDFWLSWGSIPGEFPEKGYTGVYSRAFIEFSGSLKVHVEHLTRL